LKGTLLLAALAIADNADDSGIAWPGYPLIAKKTRMSVRHVPRIITALEASKEIAIRWGGSKRGDVNTYVFMIGREQAEIDRILKIIAKKGDKLALLKACQDVMLKNKPDKLTLKKDPQKHDIAVSPEPLTMDGSLDGLMDDDPVSRFLRTLPGYNPKNLETDRRAIVANAYSLEGLHYLWEDAQTDAGENPIGLFLYRAGQGVISPAYAAALAERKREQQHQNDVAQAAAQIQQRAEQAALETPADTSALDQFVPDASLTQPLPGMTEFTPELAWTAALGELQLEMTRATYDTWVKPTVLLSVNGTWKIGVPSEYAQDWLERRLKSTVQRVLSGVVGHGVEPEFVVVRRRA
jgi:hypothetical protein